jgi:hypothetical protein
MAANVSLSAGLAEGLFIGVASTGALRIGESAVPQIAITKIKFLIRLTPQKDV